MIERKEQEFNRVEWKYPINIEKYQELMDEMQYYILPDKFPKYPVYNIYYDTPDNRIVYNSLDSTRTYKEKLRLRSYGNPTGNTPCFLEIKRKHGIVGEKKRIYTSPDEAEEYIDRKKEASGSQAEKEIVYMIKRYENLRPNYFIAYDREAYSGILKGEEDIRITFDRNIRYRKNPDCLNENGEEMYLTYMDDILMEIKTSGNYPLWLADMLTRHKLFRQPYSKYGRIYKAEKERNYV